MMVMRKALMPNRLAAAMAIGAMSAMPAMFPAPITAMANVKPKNTMGTIPTLPRASRMPCRASLFSVPFTWAWANSTMIATSTRNSDVGKPPVTWDAVSFPDPTPSTKANAKLSKPTFTRHTMPATTATTRAASETTARLMTRPQGTTAANLCLAFLADLYSCCHRLRQHAPRTVQGAREHLGHTARFGPVVVLQRLADAGERLHPVAGIEPGCVELVLEPGAARQPRVVEKRLLRLDDPIVEPAQRRSGASQPRGVQRQHPPHLGVERRGGGAKAGVGVAHCHKLDVQLAIPRLLLQLVQIPVDSLRGAGVVEGQHVRVGHPGEEDTHQLRQLDAVREAGIAEGGEEPVSVVSGVVDPVAGLEPHVERRYAQVIEKHRVVRPGPQCPEPQLFAPAPFGQLRRSGVGEPGVEHAARSEEHTSELQSPTNL